MNEMSISEFKATCLSVLEKVRESGEGVLITRFGQPVAQVIPPPSDNVEKGWMGSLAGEAEVVGDLVAPGEPIEESDDE